MTEYSTPDTGSDMQRRVSDVTQQATDQVREAGDVVRGQIGDELGRRSTDAGRQVGATGDAMRQAGAQLRAQGNDLPAQLAEQVAGQADRLGRYLRESDGETILDDLQEFARRQPWIVAGVGLAVGLGLARVLKASSRRDGSGPGYRGTFASNSYTTVPSGTRAPVAPDPPDPYGATPPPVPPSDPLPHASPGASTLGRPAPSIGEEDELPPEPEAWR